MQNQYIDMHCLTWHYDSTSAEKCKRYFIFNEKFSPRQLRMFRILNNWGLNNSL